MSLLPSPVPHPLDYSPWELPGWVYEALDWVVGVEWPEGNERAVWDLADQWYAVAAALAGPRADAVAAATEVRDGYGGVGAVAAAFDTAWRRVAEGDDAPLPVLLAISADLGRLVEECGCDIEAAKLEVWIELGILVVELLTLAVATVLTAGAASPAAGAAITASRLIVQRIFQRLMGQLARKSLRQGLQEAGERAAKEVARDGARGLARRAALGGLAEAGEESGVNLATQAYQNTTGRRHGLDVADLGTSAVGGLAGGAVAPLAGLGRHASGPAARVGEHLTREMAGEVLAEQAASLATGQGLTSVEDAARAAVSGARGSVTGQADAALRSRLDGQLSALAGAAGSLPTPAARLDAEPSAPPVPALPAEGVVPAQRSGSGVETVSSPAPAADLARSADQSPSAADAGGAAPATSASGGAGASVADGARFAGSPTVDGAPSQAGPALSAAAPAQPAAGALTGGSVASGADAGGGAGLPATGGPASTMPGSGSSGVATAGPVSAAAGVTAAGSGLSGVATTGPSPAEGATTAGGGASRAAATGPVSPAAGMPTAGSGSIGVAATGPVSGAAGVPTAGSGSSGGAANGPVSAAASVTTVGGGATARPAPPAAGVPTPGGEAHRSLPPSAGAVTLPTPAAGGTIDPGPPAPTTRFPLLAALAPVRPPTHAGPTAPEHGGPPRPGPADRRAERWTIDREAFERRRYRGYYESQRAWFEEKRRLDEAARLRGRAEEHHQRARDYTIQARRLDHAGQPYLADRWQRYADDETRAYGECLDLADEVLAGTAVPSVVGVHDPLDFRRINDDVGDLAVGAVETADRSAVTGDDDPPPIDRSRHYGRPGGLRPPLALHQTDVERRMPREPDGSVTRTADPRRGDWFRLLNDGGPAADPTRGINCLDCTLSLFDTWVHGRPRVSAPRTFDAYQDGDVTRPLDGERDGVGRIEDVTGGRFQRLCQPGSAMTAGERRHAMETGYRNLHDQLILGGHGSFAFVINSWEQGGSHIWVALNQHGTVLYLDPQTGRIGDQPLYRHSGAPQPRNAVDADVLVLGPDGRPMPMAGLRRGRFSARPDLPQYPLAVDDEGYGEPYVNRMHLLDGPGSAVPTGPDAIGPGDGEPGGTDGDRPGRLREERERARGHRLSAGTPVSAVIAESRVLDQVFAAGVTPYELAVEVDQPTLRRLTPDLDEAAADDLVRLFADPRVRDMLDRAWREPPRGEPMLAETLVRQLVERPDLVRMVLATPELSASLTARPLTLHHLASHQQAIDVLGDTLREISCRGAEAVAADGTPKPQPTLLTAEQRHVSVDLRAREQAALQPNFDGSRRNDEEYRLGYVRVLYAQAEVAQRELNRVALRLAGGRGTAGWRRAPKDHRRVLDKLVEYENDASRLKDLAAAKVQFQRLDDLYDALRELGRDPDVVVIGIEDRFLDPVRSGYRDVLLRLRMSNGHVAELRLHLDRLDRVAEWEHALYKIRRDLEALAEIHDRPLTARERAIRDGLLRREQEAFWRALGDEGSEASGR
ncbi:toxin glutamine deamidase domain-containing protein [Micromonospora sp. C28SCA-DRY-2]|uniref:toxin glutamine deamidase domain-containing protein n=1 Tax=Micromonospora sp. C28SCA-DRY-2 TaxID=3059522 RepID=UPI002674A537|nr:toxin glutamine deamidase domain-containing protein [Micromonospora sp. C28SCA-DRY-2]MDO3701068.1 toxin glutamine deamidase domain-containing protein [Micromonospora sp. C28SCA-DRY-2]